MGDVSGCANRCGFKLHFKSCCRSFSQEKKCICYPLRFPEPHVKCTTSSQFLFNLTILELHFLLQNKAYDIRFNIDGLRCIITPPSGSLTLTISRRLASPCLFSPYDDVRKRTSSQGSLYHMPFIILLLPTYILDFPGWKISLHILSSRCLLQAFHHYEGHRCIQITSIRLHLLPQQRNQTVVCYLS